MKPDAFCGFNEAVIILLFISFFFGIIIYIVTRVGESVLVRKGLVDGHKEVFESVVNDPDRLNEVATDVFYERVKDRYEVEREFVEDNLLDFYRMIASTVLRSRLGLSRTLMGMYIFCRGLLLVFPTLSVIYILFPTQYPVLHLLSLCTLLFGVFFIGYTTFKRYYVLYLITDYASIQSDPS
ncbi:hypothetical protein SAMN06264855_104243 [Halorubrum vacuolatum]|uniref:Uncharacterized protein n=1 Tax=Halorubrum vacuolatum TaxID=63740 RepID=A0A238VZ61_HALVU|nr:hypothetical protein SAMN06264855_104243 [Halorubrum vacuolatum]